MRYAAIIFDMGDIFFDATQWRRALVAHLQSVGIDIDYPELCCRWEEKLVDVYLGGCEYWEALGEFLGDLGVREEVFEDVIGAARQKAAEVGQRRTLFEGVAETLAALKQSGVRLAVLSDTESREPRVRQVLAELGIEPCFDAVVASRDIGRVKPEAEAYAIALQRLGATADQALFVGHDADELAGAIAAGIIAVAYNYEPGVRADHYLRHFRELLPLIDGVKPSLEASSPDALPSTPAPRRSFFYLMSALAGGNILASALSMIGGLLAARLVAPGAMGLFRGIGLSQGWARWLQLGVLNGLNRELPYYVGKNDRQRVQELAASAQAWAIALSALTGGGMLAVAGWYLLQGNWEVAAGWGTNAILIFFLFYGTTYLQVTFRTGHDFARLAMINVVQNSAALALVVFVWYFRFYGLCLRLLISGAIGLAMLYYWRPVRVGPRWNLQRLKQLLIVGAPIFGVGELFTWWINTLDGTLVLHFTGKEGMGLYGVVVVTAWATLEMLPAAGMTVLYPRMAEHYGRTDRLGDLLHMAVKPTVAVALGMLPIAMVSWALVGPAVKWLLPNYVAGIPAARWAVWIPVLSSFNLANNVFNVAKTQHFYVVGIGLGMVAYLGSLWWLFPKHADMAASLAAFPQAMLIGRTVCVVACLFFLAYLARRQSAPQTTPE
jgi:HAD superfamily hydrolase (TIGR01509 family)